MNIIEMRDLNEAADAFGRTTGIEVSKEAKVMLCSLANSVVDDPHETWPEPNSDELERYFDRWRTMMPALLIMIATDHGLQRKLGVVDVCCWFGSHYEALPPLFWNGACPWPKREERPPSPLLGFPWHYPPLPKF